MPGGGFDYVPSKLFYDTRAELEVTKNELAEKVLFIINQNNEICALRSLLAAAEEEKTDTSYWPEGWYEWNEYEETHWSLGEKITHWMSLPELPKAGE